MFLSRLFSHGYCPWVLKGGTSLLPPIGSGRRSRDIDLARRTQTDPGKALKELRVLVDINSRGWSRTTSVLPAGKATGF
ncbi:nucleotidyl transferase AbiEii/AbiGii toxin family protein [Corynebacterium sp. TAE3-ERU16]|uniref:nucleotidyl transferase AbiEii/AbiGii toxin family protein n=1 Tax=Corynebacterium sp. TAE3-ERU16 TaxID=2849493 RepID=UPI00351D376D